MMKAYTFKSMVLFGRSQNSQVSTSSSKNFKLKTKSFYIIVKPSSSQNRKSKSQVRFIFRKKRIKRAFFNGEKGKVWFFLFLIS